eukprot:3214529-Rhodomonas_salina.2
MCLRVGDQLFKCSFRGRGTLDPDSSQQGSRDPTDGHVILNVNVKWVETGVCSLSVDDTLDLFIKQHSVPPPPFIQELDMNFEENIQGR